MPLAVFFLVLCGTAVAGVWFVMSACTVGAGSVETLAADFIYLDFNDTTGLAFVGTSATTSCDGGELVMTVLG
jgi:hypothetical protein